MTYTIKEVSEIFDLSIYTLRYYDKQGLLPFVSKNASGYREFTESDLGFIYTICCLKNTGMPLKDIRTYIDYCMQGVSYY
jgi:DNA-binding transcriptional MerR regulator